ncbi:hypothetical protein RND61_16900 [Streptomyces sp. TRM76323]|uniref:Uncharacterized protein n=1 Tax=Streptomyces tamarix TaxID=3078565 RepID=A0ABU3QLU9_9ACTN|nr:hypothetical protein [Streptomyces tamarix]MDT9683727.1 hypothetical protein [Streptomyces tamarix]
MHMIEAIFAAPDKTATGRIEEALVADILWISARPDDCLEHIYSESGHGRLQITFFIRSKPLAAAHDTVAAICRRALLAAPALRGWQLLDAADPDGRPYPSSRRTPP